MRGFDDYALAHSTNYAATENYMIAEGFPMIIDAYAPSGHSSFPELRPADNGHGVVFLPTLSPSEDSPSQPDKANAVSLSVAALEERPLKGVAEEPLAAIGLWRCAFAYRDEQQSWRRHLAHERALKYSSAAPVFDAGNAHRRRKAERQREPVFRKRPSSAGQGACAQ